MIYKQREVNNFSGVLNPYGGEQSEVGLKLEPFRRELLLHCYRLLGSLHDAEDTVQETMLKAWRRFDTFTDKGPGSLRAWLYTIATNASLDALKKGTSRTLPTVAFPVANADQPVAPRNAEILWLEPFPDSWLGEMTENPEARYTRFESVSLAFLIALQLLPPRQRAILLLCDVLDWQASETANLLKITVSAVNSALHRARVTLEKNYKSNKREQEVSQPADTDGATNELLARYLKCWEADDVEGLVTLLKEDATLSMPPVPSWYQGREAVRVILRDVVFQSDGRKRWRLIPTYANGQPAFLVYRAANAQSPYKAFAVQVLTLDPELNQVQDITAFLDPTLVKAFSLSGGWQVLSGSPPTEP
jgi:RNA polymerase sigma-70 factor (ECF subfamily)